MAFKKIKELRASVLKELTLVTGSSVQTYTEPLIDQQIENAAKHYFKMRYWDHLTVAERYTLDGAAGVANVTVAKIDDANDIQWLRTYPFRDCDEVPYRANGVFEEGELGWSMFPHGHAQRDVKNFYVHPITATGDVKIRVRRLIVNFAVEDEIVPFDDIMLQHFVASMMLASDGMNSSMQQIQMALAEDRYSNIIASEADKPIYGKSAFRRTENSFTVAP